MLNTELARQIEELFKKYVPSSGDCSTHGGECIRAINRIAYRYYNDGDLFHTGYGSEMAGEPASFLCYRTNDEIYDIITTEHSNRFDYRYEEDDVISKHYEEFLTKLTQAVLNYVSEPNQFEVPLIIGMFGVNNSFLECESYEEDDFDEDEDE